MMKKIVSVVLIVLMSLALFSSCGNEGQNVKEASTIIANYSIKNSDDSDDFIVEVQDLGGVYSELYDEDGLYIKFKGGHENIYDSKGSLLTRDDLKTGATLEICYDGKLAKENPKTIKAYKVTVID